MIIDKIVGYSISALGGSTLSLLTLSRVWETALVAFIIGVFGGLGGIVVKFLADQIFKKKKE